MAQNLTEGGRILVCSEFDSYDYVIVAAVSAGSAMVSVLCCVFVICLIFLFKKHYFFIQRIILYHCLAALFRSLSTILRLHRLGYQNETAALNAVCVLSAFTNQTSLWVLIVDYYVITFTLLMTAVFRKNVSRLEGLFVVLIFIFPLTFNWIPFINNSYGRFGPWCWIRRIDYSDCSEYQFGRILQIVLWNAPFVLLVITLVPMYITTIAYIAVQMCCKRKKKEEHLRDDPDGERLKRHLHDEVWWSILFLPFGVLFFNIFPLIRMIYEAANDGEPSYTIWMLSVIFSPLQGGYIALIYVLDRQTLKRLTYSNMKARLTRKKTVTEYPMVCDGISDSTVVDIYSPVTNYRPYGHNLR